MIYPVSDWRPASYWHLSVPKSSIRCILHQIGIFLSQKARFDVSCMKRKWRENEEKMKRKASVVNTKTFMWLRNLYVVKELVVFYAVKSSSLSIEFFRDLYLFSTCIEMCFFCWALGEEDEERALWFYGHDTSWYILILVFPCFLLHVKSLDWIFWIQCHRMSSPGQHLAMIKSMLLWCWWPFEACRMAIRGQTIHGFQGLKCGGVSLVMLSGNKGCMMDVKCKICLKVVAPTTTKSKDRKSQTDLENLVYSCLFTCEISIGLRRGYARCQSYKLRIHFQTRFHCDKASMWWIMFFLKHNVPCPLQAIHVRYTLIYPHQTEVSEMWWVLFHQSVGFCISTLKQIQHLITCSSLGAKTVYKYINILG